VTDTKRLIDIFGKQSVLIEEKDKEPYGHDETPGLFFLPEAVVKPTDIKQITELLKLANSDNFAVVPRGGGTGLAGGCVPTEGGVVVSLEKFNKHCEIDAFNSVAVCDAGLINSNLQAEAKKHDLFYPVNPASQDTCTIGGNVATAAGGANAVRYGTTKDYVVGVEAVLPDGRLITAGGRLHKNATDHRLIQLLLGSEGTLAIIIKVILKLIPQPKHTVVLIIPFDDLKLIPKLLEEITTHRINPTMVEYTDQRTLDIAQRYADGKLPLDAGPKGHILIRIDADDKDVLTKSFEKIGEVALVAGALDVLVVEEASRQDAIWNARKSFHDANMHVGKMVADEDVVVPKSEILNLLVGAEKISVKTGIPISAFGHLGDGNLHVNFLSEGADKEKVMKALPEGLDSLFKLVGELGGKISGEHGIGVFKKPYLKYSVDDTSLDVLKKIKASFDPQGILNPGKIF